MIIGDPDFVIEDDRTDRVGLVSLSLSKVWAPESTSSIEAIRASKPAPPEVGALMELVAAITRPDGGAMKTQWWFEGVDGDAKGPIFRTRLTSRDSEFSPGFSQVDIGLHPKLQELIDAYEGQVVDGEIYFPPTIERGSKSPLAKGGAGQQSSSPVALVRDFLRMEGTYSHRYMSLDISGIQNGVGTIFEGGLPGSPPPLTDGRNWLKAPTAYQRRGLVFEILESYWLSGPGGWPRPIYGGSIGGGRGSGSGGGLQTGGLQTGSL